MSAWIALLLSASASAQKEPEWSQGDDAKLYACLEQSGASDPEMRECWRQYAQREDARLNHNWRILIERAGGRETFAGKALVAEQRAWLAFRDASCQYFENATLDRLQQQICYTARIVSRADELAGMVSELDAYKVNQNLRTEE
ncbi:MAG: lysozyme inhibitor LprI family protein [Erythrobacter sp.]